VVHQARQLADEIETAMLIGHNPTWTMLCQRLTGEPLDNLPTCGILVLEFPLTHWKDLGNLPGTLIAVLRPKDFSSEV
jgi:phosphohistidine phosphatase